VGVPKKKINFDLNQENKKNWADVSSWARSVNEAVEDNDTRLSTTESNVTELQSSQKTYWQIKTLNTTVSANTSDIADLRFNNLEAGKDYRLSGATQVRTTTSGGTAQIRFRENNNIIGIVFHRQLSASGDLESVYGINILFKATENGVLTVDFTEGGPALFYGDGTRDQSYLILEELPNHVETDKWS